MDDCTVALIACDRTEGLIGEVLSHSAELVQFICQRALSLGLSVCKGFLFEPFEETGESDGILAHRNAFTFQFDGIFLGFVDEDRGFGVDLLAALRNCFVQRLVDASTVVEDGTVEAVDIVKYRFVGLDVDVVEVEVVLRRRIHFVRIYEEGTFIVFEHGVRDDNGVIFHIFSSNVE